MSAWRTLMSWCRRGPDGRETSLRSAAVHAQAGQLVGQRAWSLVWQYGKIMKGSYGGLYVSGIDCELQLDVARRLASGETLNIHLMHRHRSGQYEVSGLKLREGRLIMVSQTEKCSRWKRKMTNC